jgi:predicted nuclease of predicted toxin-antitoxin system
VKGYLLDENLPDQLITTATRPIYHVREFGQGLTDSTLWELARQEQWAIVTKGADFVDRIIGDTPPPWIVHLRLGNLRLNEFRTFIAHTWPQVESLLPDHKLINVYIDAIEAIAH